jgi:hypothetical protein
MKAFHVCGKYYLWQNVVFCIKPENIPSEDEEVSLAKVLGPYRSVLLKEQSGERAIAIWIGPFEADSIVFQLKQMETKRPLTYELIKTLLDLGKVVVERMVVSRLDEETFYSNLVVKTGSTVSEVDCRPSDGLNLALRLDVPIFVDAEMMEQLSFTPDAAGNYSWADYWRLRMRQAPESKKDDVSKMRDFTWLSALKIDEEQLAQGYIKIGERRVHLDPESRASYTKLMAIFK